MGLHKCSHRIYFRPLRANLRPLVRVVCSHHGPIQAFFSPAIPLTENYVGPCDSLVQQPTVCVGAHERQFVSTSPHEMGPCKHLAPISFSLLWANMSSLVRAVHSHHRPRQAFCSAAIDKYTGPCDSLTLRPIVCPVGQLNVFIALSHAMARCVHGGP
jgi:hypothetical protein